MDWDKRSIELEQKLFKNTQKYTKKMMEIYAAHAQAIEKDIALFINKYADENGLTFAEASKNLTREEKAEYKEAIEKILKKYETSGSAEFKEHSNELKKRKVRTRLDSIRGQIDARTYLLTEDINNDVKDHLEETYLLAYMGMEDILVEGLGLAEVLYPKKAPEKVTTYPYSGILYTALMWKCTSKIATSVFETLQRGLVQKHSATQIAKELTRQLKHKGKYTNYDLERVVRTETGFSREVAVQDVFEQHNIKKYMIVCAPDERTCKHCRERDGEEHLESERVQGETAPPFHPNCRCVTKIVEESLE